MNVFRITTNVDGYLSLMLVNQNDDDSFDAIGTGVSLIKDWPRINVRVYHERDRIPSDCPWLFDATCLILNTRAVQLLRDEFERYGELLPLEGEDQMYYAWNVLVESDALDVERSKLWRFDDGAIGWVDEFVLHKNRITPGAFRLDVDGPTSRLVFVTDDLKDRICETDLQGFEFRHVWSSES